MVVKIFQECLPGDRPGQRGRRKWPFPVHLLGEGEAQGCLLHSVSFLHARATPRQGCYSFSIVRALSPRAVKGPAYIVQLASSGTESCTQVWLDLGASRTWPQGSPHFIHEETELLGEGMACPKSLWYNKKYVWALTSVSDTKLGTGSCFPDRKC